MKIHGISCIIGLLLFVAIGAKAKTEHKKKKNILRHAQDERKKGKHKKRVHPRKHKKTKKHPTRRRVQKRRPTKKPRRRPMRPAPQPIMVPTAPIIQPVAPAPEIPSVVTPAPAPINAPLIALTADFTRRAAAAQTTDDIVKLERLLEDIYALDHGGAKRLEATLAQARNRIQIIIPEPVVLPVPAEPVVKPPTRVPPTAPGYPGAAPAAEPTFEIPNK